MIRGGCHLARDRVVDACMYVCGRNIWGDWSDRCDRCLHCFVSPYKPPHLTQDESVENMVKGVYEEVDRRFFSHSTSFRERVNVNEHVDAGMLL